MKDYKKKNIKNPRRLNFSANEESNRIFNLLKRRYNVSAIIRDALRDYYEGLPQCEKEELETLAFGSE